MIEVRYLTPHLTSRHPQDWKQNSKSFDSLTNAIAFSRSVQNSEYKTFIFLPAGGKMLRIESRGFRTGVVELVDLV